MPVIINTVTEGGTACISPGLLFSKLICLGRVKEVAFSEYRRLFITPSPLVLSLLKPAQPARRSIFHLALLSYSLSLSLLGTNPLTHHHLPSSPPPSNYAITQISSFLPPLPVAPCTGREIGLESEAVANRPTISFNLQQSLIDERKM